ncbi:MAG: sugar ABC transporter permease, partial [Clostridiales bacterium]|nr:sugar ABC transporter permease [Clostridiales bacterium]
MAPYTTRARTLLGKEADSWRRALRQDYDLYLMLIPVIAFFAVFSYMPMYGLQIAFKDFSPALGIEDSPYVGLKHLYRFVRSFYFGRVVGNTLTMSLLNLLLKIPAPIVLALLFNEVRSKQKQAAMQIISYTPNFVSTVVLSSMIVMFLTPGTGSLDSAIRWFGYGKETSILSSPKAFKHIYVLSETWQSMGWNSIIYTAAIAAVPPEIYEVARLDGANKLKQAWYVTLPF